MKRTETYPKTARLLRRRDFLAVQRRGVRIHGRYLVAILSRSSAATFRLGITASKKVGNAVERNRVKRLLRENFRRRFRDWPDGYDMVLIARKSATTASFDDLGREISSLVGRALKKSAVPKKPRRGSD